MHTLIFIISIFYSEDDLQTNVYFHIHCPKCPMPKSLARQKRFEDTEGENQKVSIEEQTIQ